MVYGRDSHLLESAVRVSRLGVGEEHTALKVGAVNPVRGPGNVDGSVVHEEEDAAPGALQVGPTVLDDGVVEGLVAEPHVVGGEQLIGAEDAANLLIQAVQELDGIPGDDLGATLARVLLLGGLELHHDGDGHGVRVLVHPGLDDLQAGDERLAEGVDVRVGHVQHLDAGLLPHRVVVVGQLGLLADEGLGVVAALGIGEDVDLEVAHLLVA